MKFVSKLYNQLQGNQKEIAVCICNYNKYYDGLLKMCSQSGNDVQNSSLAKICGNGSVPGGVAVFLALQMSPAFAGCVAVWTEAFLALRCLRCRLFPLPRFIPSASLVKCPVHDNSLYSLAGHAFFLYLPLFDYVLW